MAGTLTGVDLGADLLAFNPVSNKSDRVALEKGYYFDREAAWYAVYFIEHYVRQGEGEWAGKLVELLRWQKERIWRMFGWKRPNGARRFRTIFIEVPKKNGKTTLTAGVTLKLEVADGERGPQIYLGAVDRGQAETLFRMVTAAIAQEPELAAMMDVVESRKTIHCSENGGFIKAMSADAPSKDGVNAHAVVFDELHAFKNDNLYTVMQGSKTVRRQPIQVVITTAGNNFSTACWRLHELTRRINEDEIVNLEHDGIIYGAEPGDEVWDPATWRKANPSMGRLEDGCLMTEEDFRSDMQLAFEMGEGAKADFLRRRLGIWQRGESKFIPSAVWDECKIEYEGPVGEFPVGVKEDTPCYIGVDLASTLDLASVCLMFGSLDTRFVAFSYNWAPEEMCLQRERENRGRFLSWASEGWLRQCPGSSIKHKMLSDFIVEANRRFNVKLCAIDPAGDALVQADLLENGVPLKKLRQGFISLNNPTKKVQELVRAGKLLHVGNPVLDWAVGNAVLIQDSVANQRIDRSARREKIDPVAALLDAMGAALDYEVEQRAAAIRAAAVGFSW